MLCSVCPLVHLLSCVHDFVESTDWSLRLPAAGRIDCFFLCSNVHSLAALIKHNEPIENAPRRRAGPQKCSNGNRSYISPRSLSLFPAVPRVAPRRASFPARPLYFSVFCSHSLCLSASHGSPCSSLLVLSRGLSPRPCVHPPYSLCVAFFVLRERYEDRPIRVGLVCKQ